MTDPDEQSSTPSPDAAVPTHDALLEMLVSLTHKLGMEVGVTLNLPGAVVSGVLVSRERWLDGLADSQESDTCARSARRSAGQLAGGGRQEPTEG